ncbi:PSD1 and planctomycete cytochrome C domain-containing protein [Pelagicoccus mobilis]|uniref:PSD1 domain-containing protein n=1 Tax=Pelagicoccus mobilis TaxID=415221 RepID=A0A934VR73_9BACT|nr:PSD1 and planctomycete cytochrome C domain-containing protein [Pelagicoccus mobilis]MBK1877625.1 PSD1 domain-containing protein [Pelagicoccus mobilis]
MKPFPHTIGSFAAFLLVGFSTSADELSNEDLQFFESEVRPLLIDNCYKCHSADAEKIRGHFLIDSAPAMLRGGESGPAIVPGNSAESRLIQMVKRHPDYEAMPPKSKLAPEEIETLIAWIDRGAPDPRVEESLSAADLSDFNLEERKKWWSLQPVNTPEIPEVKNADWPANDYDNFLLSKLEEKGWQPAESTDRRTLLRRLSFDLIGLAPTPEELESFLSDNSPDAYQKQVDRLLASPHFGEKWARHWLDLVRYAETKAFEADYTMTHAYRYRDYIINALNQDVPFDQFILESLAGDLIEEPRINPTTGDNESVMGPGFIYLTDGQHGPPDIHEDEARIFDGMIDVTSKAFLGSTLACARCHDHKFDAITTGDYYSFYGMLRSSRLSYANTVPDSAQQAPLRELKKKRASLEKLAFDATLEDINQVSAYLEATRELANSPTVQSIVSDYNKETKEDQKLRNQGPKVLKQRLASESKALATHKGLDSEALTNWLILATNAKARSKHASLAPLFQQEKTKSPQRDKDLSQSFADVSKSLYNWKYQGLAFQDQAPSAGTPVFTSQGHNGVQSLVDGQHTSGYLAGRVTGALRSPDFIIDGKPIELQAKGNGGTVRLVIRNYELTGRGPTTGKLYKAINTKDWETIRFQTYLWEGEPAYLEFAQNNVSNHSKHPKHGPHNEPSDDAFLTFRFHSTNDWEHYWKTSGDSAEAVGKKLKQLWAAGKKRKLSPTDAEVLGSFYAVGLINADTRRNKTFDKALREYRELALTIPKPRFARSLVDGDQHDEPIYIRGSHNNLSQDHNPRRFFDAFGGKELTSRGSGRLDWAKEVADPENPLTARVQVNRLWKHIFGAGLVETTNDFGQMGKLPTHPDLLDHLANDFVENNWSIKHMIRKMVSTKAYQMSSQPSELAQQEDPQNSLLQHMPVKRLEAELIRDHILASSGALNTKQFGPSVSAYVDDMPNSRAKPPTGPLNGDGRRSIYLEMRRNFLSTFLRAFDMPNATESIGKRQVTNVPAQSLALMNDPFVHEQAKAWANKVMASSETEDERIHKIHIDAFSRPASPKELDWAKRFLSELSRDYGSSSSDLTVWTDLCHMIYNRKEFIYIF